MRGLLVVRDLAVRHRGSDKPVVSGLSWRQSPGEVIIVKGPNASGKSTLLGGLGGDPRILLTGSVEFMGARVKRTPRSWWRMGVRWVPQAKSSFDALTVSENLRTVAEAEGAAQLEPALQLFPPLEKVLERQIRHLSGGQRKMVSLGALALCHAPKMFWLDEPFEQLSDINADRLSSFLREKTEEGTSLLIATHRRLPELKASVVDLARGDEEDHDARPALPAGEDNSRAL